MSLWSIVKSSPTQTLTNWLLNPSAETDMAGWSTFGGGSVSRSADQSRFGAYSVAVGMAFVGSGAQLAETFLGNTGSYYVSLYLYSPTTGPVNVDVWDGLTLRYSATVSLQAGTWKRVVFPSTTLTKGQVVQIKIWYYPSGGTPTVYVDGLMVCEVNSPYFDGDSEGCWWLGRAHGSPSRADSYADLYGDTVDLDAASATVVGWTGAGVPPTSVVETALPTDLVGAAYAGTKVNSRTLQLLLRVRGNSLTELHELRRKLVEMLRPGARVVVNYSGAGRTQSLVARYAGGLEGQRSPGTGFSEEVALRLVASDPLWREDSQVGATLQLNDSAAFSRILARVNGKWTTLNGGANGSVYAIKVAPSGEVYVGGAFTTAGGVTVNGIAKYDPLSNTWSALGSGVSGGAVYAIELDTSGNVYAGGSFSSAGGAPNTDGIAKYDPKTGTWSALGTGRTTSGSVYALAYSPLGYLYAGGDFDGMSGVANTARLAVYNLTAGSWESVTPTAPPDNTVRAIVVIPDVGVHVGGDFTAVNDVIAKSVAFLDTRTNLWNPLGSGLNSIVRHLLLDPRSGYLYAVGAFTQSGPDTVRGFARWNSVWWEEVGGGLTTGEGRQMAFLPDGRIVVAGTFRYFGGKTAPVFKGLAVWNGTDWSYLDLISGAWDSFNCVATRGDDIYLGSDLAQTVYFAGSTLITNPGSAPVRPVIYLRGACRVWWIGNRTLRRVVYMGGLQLGPGEETIVDLDKLQMTSRWRPGNLMYAAWPTSDFANWELAPGLNDVALGAANTDANAFAKIVFVPQNWSVDLSAS